MEKETYGLAPGTHTNSSAPPLMPTPELIALLLRAAPGVTNIILSPMRPPEVERNGLFLAMDLPSVPFLVPDDTSRITNELIGGNAKLHSRLQDDGSCDFAWFLPRLGRFRVSIFSQRGSYALNRMNQEKSIRILTIEDPIEFLLPHIRATIHQRELHRDFPSFRIALSAALRQPPHVILLGALPDRETMELAFQAAESGHLVLSSLHTPDAARTLDYILCFFPEARHREIRARLAAAVRAVVSQRLLPRKDGAGRVAIFEILRSTPRVRACLKEGQEIGPALEAAILEGGSDGMQSFRAELARLVKEGILDAASAGAEGALLDPRGPDGPGETSASQAAPAKKPGQR
jgi:twitching motility protein PilT